MSIQLGTSKRLLTHYTKKLDTVISRFKTEQLETLSAASIEDESSPYFIRESIRQLEEGIGAINTATTKTEELLREYAIELAELENASQKDQDDFEEYSSKAETALTSAFDYTLLLQARLRAFKSCVDQMIPSASRTTLGENILNGRSPTTKFELPTLPIPTFRGNIWDWANFWELFNANVHSQPLPDLYKFNYLLNALKGEAYESVKKFQVTPDNYMKAIDFLRNKYENTEELVTRLIDRLENCQLRSPLLKDQRSLLEQIQVVIMQLLRQGEQVDGQWFIKQVLSKFPTTVQRKVLTKRHSLPAENPFKMETLLKFLEEIISGEEMISLYMKKNFTSPSMDNPSKQTREQHKFRNNECMYCGKSHKSFECDRYKTPQERSKYLREHKLCLICASPQHLTSQCKKRHCFQCQGAHHTSCCFKFHPHVRPSSPITESNNQVHQAKRSGLKNNQAKDSRTTKFSRKVNQLSTEQPSQEETAILELQSAHGVKQAQGTFLPTGEMTVLDPKTKTLQRIPVLFDTGAGVSFIDTTLANELNLPTIEKTKLRLHTFGSEQVHESNCRRVSLEVWDSEGKPFSLNLITHDILTKSFVAPPIRDEDVEFIKCRNLPIQLCRNTATVKPLVLLGCDQLWSLVRDDQAHIQLPSGLHLLPTRLGHLLTGQLNHLSQVTDEKQLSEKDTWNGYWTLEAQVHMMTTSLQTEEDNHEQDMWEKFWALEAAGTEEFSNSEREEQALVDKQVWDNFKKTVEKRKDGYYVRLPWKDITTKLPDNKAIAYRRLISVWNSLQKSEDLLDKYHEVFQEQLRLNILEQVVEDVEPKDRRIHYIPHQAVLTPHKTTTKLRIVYDASAHYKGSPSLNDVLHRGPVILPLLYGVLLRFRIGRIAIISDVEKAFLQVRLHEIDRDATRCFWLRNYKLPPSNENIQVLRFTRVTFGLMPSPFLLAATTHYHLDQYEHDRKLVEEMKENLYVDNLILCVDTAEEATYTCSRTKQMFKELNMNLREFASNNPETMKSIPDKDRSSEHVPKVLGIKWDSATDHLDISCSLENNPRVTKRIVASAIASIYDPLGWLVPLLHKAKVFLRLLWKENFDWDTKLPQERENEWTRIGEEIRGFRKIIPRFLCCKQANPMIITFADASAEAIASCVYLRSSHSANLMMAKGKLPTLKSATTMPKMELNAATLAMRLTNSVVSQLQSVLTIQQVFIFSDSEIVLGWIRKKPLKDAGLMVFNRLVEIDKIIANLQNLGCHVQFGHVPSTENPADCGTRGLGKTEFLNHFWWEGPKFLKKEPQTWAKEYKLFHSDSSSEGNEEEQATHKEDHLTKCERKFYEADRGSRDQVLVDQLKEEWNTVEERLTTQVSGLQDKLQERGKRIEQLEAKVVELEQAAAEDPGRPDECKGEERVVSDHESSRSRRHSVDDRQVQEVEDQGVPDAEYWERMVDEIKEDRRADNSADPFQKPKLIPISPATSEEGVEPLPKSPRMDSHPVSRDDELVDNDEVA
ncbi:hypothetical protein Aduo_005656 [Ancylostoma duodenale]